MINALSVDVEEYFHATNLEPFAPPRRWHTLPSRVENSTRRVLDLFAKCNTKGTFFILGYVARRHPSLVKEIAGAGHEIASHGYGHRLAFSQTPKAYYRDVHRTKRLLEDISGTEVLGYRAPSFSITHANPWAYDQLLRAGYRYDSSIYPTWHPRYANLNRSPEPERIVRTGGQLKELPLAVACLPLVGGHHVRIPVAGGAYWRLFPRPLVAWGLGRINEREGRSFTCYLHPWELDNDQPRFPKMGYLTRVRHYGGVAAFDKRVEWFCRKFKFAPIAEVWRDFLVDHQ